MRSAVKKLLLTMCVLASLAACREDGTPLWEEEARTTPSTGTDKADELEYQEGVAGSRIVNMSGILDALNLKSYHDLGYRGQNTVIAILDNGYTGLREARGKTLPPQLRVEPGFEGEEAETAHGTKMAEIAYAMATGRNAYDPQVSGPEMRLFVTNGPYRNLSDSVDKLIEMKRQRPQTTFIALYSQIWEYGGNLNGTGYINEIVNRALAAGVVWVNAAGNLGRGTYLSKVEYDKATREMKLPSNNRFIKMNVPATPTQIKIVLAWKDFTDSYYNYFTKQDLDLVLETTSGKEIARAALRQDGQNHGNEKGYSRHAREVMTANLSAGTYHLRVLVKSDNFDASSRFWVTASGEGVELENANGHQSVMIPADNPNVLTVGASDVNYGNATILEDGRVLKPDFLTPSLIEFADGTIVHGTSTATAVAAGALALYRSAYGSLSFASAKKMLEDGTLTNGRVHNLSLYQRCHSQPNPPAIFNCAEYGQWIPPLLVLPKIATR